MSFPHLKSDEAISRTKINMEINTAFTCQGRSHCDVLLSRAQTMRVARRLHSSTFPTITVATFEIRTPSARAGSNLPLRTRICAFFFLIKRVMISYGYWFGCLAGAFTDPGRFGR